MPEALRVVLFGMPDAGKSSLLGALAQAAQTQEHVLAGRLSDPTKGLAGLQEQTYEGRPGQTLEDAVGYPVIYEPTGTLPAGQRIDAELVDSDGRTANELLVHPRPLDRASQTGNLAQAIREASVAVKRAEARAPEFFPEPLPPPCEVTPMPEVVASSGAAPHYTPPRLDGGRAGPFERMPGGIKAGRG